MGLILQQQKYCNLENVVQWPTMGKSREQETNVPFMEERDISDGLL